MLTHAILLRADSVATNAAIAAFSSDPMFIEFAARETQETLDRDREDVTKLTQGIRRAVARGVLTPDPPVEALTIIDVLGASVDTIVERILTALGYEGLEASSGCIIVLSGLSGTGKGTTVEALQRALPRSVTWSNGNIFRALTFLVLEHCESTATELSEETLTPALLGSLLSRLEFSRGSDGHYDTKICTAEGKSLLVSQVQNTKLKDPRISKAIPLVAGMSQGEVVSFSAKAAERMRADGLTVIIEGRVQTLEYVRTKHRFELILSDPGVIGQRRAAQRIVAEAVSSLNARAGVGGGHASDAQALSACEAALRKLASRPRVAGDGDRSIMGKSSSAHLVEVQAYCTQHALQAKLSTAITHALSSNYSDPALGIACGMLEQVNFAAELAPVRAALVALAAMPTEDARRALRGDETGAASNDNAFDGLARLLARSRPVAKPYTESVLRGHVMKCDEFDSIHLLKSERLHPEVWNFRRAGAYMQLPALLPVWGVGQCHLGGIEWYLRQLSDVGYTEVYALNMREEPVCFIDGKACAPRVINDMNENLAYLSGIRGDELEAMEIKMKDECASAAATSDGTVQVYFQRPGMVNEVEQLPMIAPAAVSETACSVREAYSRIASRPGMPKLRHHRLPIADEEPPSSDIITELVELLQHVDHAGTIAVVFNCQMGRGRTTTGMVCASILLRARAGWSVEALSPPPPPLPAADSEERSLSRGEFKGLLKLLILLDDTVAGRGGTVDAANLPVGFMMAPQSTSRRQPASFGIAAKALCDACVAECGEAQNLVTAIERCKADAAKATQSESRSSAFWMKRGKNYLERYAMLVVFAAYCLKEAPVGFKQPFSTWLRARWQLSRIISDLTLD